MASITARKNKDGKITSYRIKVFRKYDMNGKQLKPYSMEWHPPAGWKQKKIEKELAKVAADFERKCGDEIHIENPRFADYCKTYLELSVLAPRTQEMYSRLIDKEFNPIFGNMKIAEITPIHCAKYMKQLESSKNQKGEPLSPQTVQRKMHALSSIFERAVKDRMLKDNPAHIEMPKAVKKPVQVFTKEEMAYLLDCLLDEPLWFQCFVHLAFAAGARLAEITALKFSDIDFDRCKITIERSASAVSGGVTLKPPKDNEIRTVTIYPEAIELVRRLQMEREQQRRKLGTAWHNEDWLFSQWDGSLMYPKITKRWNAFLKRHDIQHRKFHALRHTSATLMLCNDVNIRQVQARLGHSSIKTTQIYLHAMQDADEQAAVSLQSVLIKQTVVKKAE